MMERRNFLRFASFGMIGAAAPTAAMAANEKKVISNSELDGPICTETLQIQSGTKKKTVKRAEFDGGISFWGPEYEEHKQVAMAVGQDGNLWLKTEDGKWKRIVTE
jgi:hypothetical protein